MKLNYELSMSILINTFEFFLMCYRAHNTTALVCSITWMVRKRLSMSLLGFVTPEVISKSMWKKLGHDGGCVCTTIEAGTQ